MGYIKNREQLLARGETALRRLALDIAEAGIAYADPGNALRRQISMEGDALLIEGRLYGGEAGSRIFVVGAGKASFPIAKALDELLGERIHKGIVTCKYGQEGTLDHIELRLASHPIPDQASLEAAAATVELLREVRSGDIVLCCFTGGSSSLFVSLVPGITLQDKAIANDILLTCGANIIEINDVRKHLSTVKGARLIRDLAPGVTVINLTVSDVIGDALDYITDPSFPDQSTFADAQAVLDKYRLWDRMPVAIASFLRMAPPEHETVREQELEHLSRHDVILVSADAACIGAADEARRAGITPLLLSTFFEGESSALGRNLVAIAKQIALDGRPLSPPCILIGGGETTVTTSEKRGTGGPNQEFAVSAALELAGTTGIAVVGLDTDGTDGPTQYAGGVADGSTAGLAIELGVDLHQALTHHDVTPALERIFHVVKTGATGTNVNDLKLVLVMNPV
ncbi:DUF4147 domain-containing protein|uniref:glycerate kinase type-2 family protein n=1 Tax=Pseudomonas sp. SbOxS1 TaxID=2723884 RepID=UPI0015D238A6|nr:DUF4147 domain-containing protein [Pseudomonas sp. SbOxS1]NYU03037.1 DUF4147 domain-containing protein [Pseudomonas sp. SbOxS1]